MPYQAILLSCLKLTPFVRRGKGSYGAQNSGKRYLRKGQRPSDFPAALPSATWRVFACVQGVQGVQGDLGMSPAWDTPS